MKILAGSSENLHMSENKWEPMRTCAAKTTAKWRERMWASVSATDADVHGEADAEGPKATGGGGGETVTMGCPRRHGASGKGGRFRKSV